MLCYSKRFLHFHKFLGQIHALNLLQEPFLHFSKMEVGVILSSCAKKRVFIKSSCLFEGLLNFMGL